MAARTRAHRLLAEYILFQHRQRQYDVLYQFSQIELFRLRRFRTELPPIVLHPEVHAAGELRWHRRERGLVKRLEPRGRRLAVRATLMTRAKLQQHDMALASCVIAPSRTFADHLAREYRLPMDRLEVIPNPIDLDRLQLLRPDREQPEGPITILFIARLSVRKGLEMVTRLSHRLADLERHVRIRVVALTRFNGHGC